MLAKGAGKLAPADLLLDDVCYPGGLCVDVSVGLRSVQTAEQRAVQKTRKYTAMMTAYPAYGFAPFIVETTGDVNNAAHTLMRRWASGLVARALEHGLPPDNSHDAVVTRVAHAFAAGLTDTIAAFYTEPL